MNKILVGMFDFFKDECMDNLDGAIKPIKVREGSFELLIGFIIVFSNGLEILKDDYTFDIFLEMCEEQVLNEWITIELTTTHDAHRYKSLRITPTDKGKNYLNYILKL